MSGRLRWLQFVILGGLLFVGVEWFESGREGLERLEISRESYDGLRRSATQQLGRSPSDEELAGFLEALIAEEILVREARLRRFDRDDPVVRRRLLQNMRFLGSDEDANDEQLLREAIELGLEQSDIVVRRRLAQRMRLAVEASARREEPAESELLRYLEENRERFEFPPRLRFRQIFFDSTRRADAAADARAALAMPLEERLQSGDPLPLAFGGWISQPEVERRLGSGFAEALFAVEGKGWTGPIESPYGQHIVRVKERRPGAMPPLDMVRERVRLGLLAERGELALRDQLEIWRSNYEIVLPPPD